MKTFYFVDPSVQGQDPLPQENPAPPAQAVVVGPYNEGQNVVLPTGRRVEPVRHWPEGYVYESIQDATPWPTPEDYYDYVTLLHYETNADPALIRVREERDPQEIPIAQAQAQRKAELEATAAEVDEQGLEVAGMSAGTVAVLTDQRSRIFYSSFQLGTIWPGATTIRRIDQFRIWYGHTKEDCTACNEQLAVYHDAVISANDEDLENQIDAATTVDEVLAVDLDSGWPPAPTPPGQASADTVESRAAALLQVIWSDPSAAPAIRDAGDPGRIWRFLRRDGNDRRDIAALRVAWARGNGH